ncbi:hypothetical protein EVAR_94725_1 [Eumeta japonica]|uniref:Uncharacterized protein n=1 Tax=Eumeta variegata TaxID=151549 RepID=A0A4C1UVS8_EUMVA|nr:hypothetical protein EVAR_94725_1 [Eumeta japonica]
MKTTKLRIYVHISVQGAAQIPRRKKKTEPDDGPARHKLYAGGHRGDYEIGETRAGSPALAAHGLRRINISSPSRTYRSCNMNEQYSSKEQKKTPTLDLLITTCSTYRQITHCTWVETEYGTKIRIKSVTGTEIRTASGPELKTGTTLGLTEKSFNKKDEGTHSMSMRVRPRAKS